MRWLSRDGSAEHPTTAQVLVSSKIRRRTASSSGHMVPVYRGGATSPSSECVRPVQALRDGEPVAHDAGRHVHPERRRHPAAAAVEGREPALRDRAGDDPHLVGPPRPARPAGSCGRTGRTRTTARARRARSGPVVAGEQPAGGVGRPLDARCPSARPASPRRTPGSASGRRRRRPRRRGRRGRSSSHTTPSSSARPEPSSHSVLGVTPMPTTTTSASTVVPSARRTRSTRPSPSMPSTPTPSAQVDAVVAVDVAAHRAHLRRRAPRASGTGSASTRVTVEAAPAAGRRHLGADEPGADDHDPAGRRRRGRPGARSAVVERAQHVDAGAAAGRPASVRGAAPVAMTRPSNGSSLAVGQARPRAGEVERRRRACRAASRGRGRRRVPPGSAVCSGSQSPGEHLLGQRRPVVGQVRLVADEGEAAVEALLAAAPRRPGGRPATRRRRRSVAAHGWRRSVSDGFDGAQSSMRDGLLGAAAHRLLDLGAQLLGRASPAARRGSRRHGPRTPPARRPCRPRCSRTGRSRRRHACCLPKIGTGSLLRPRHGSPVAGHHSRSAAAELAGAHRPIHPCRTSRPRRRRRRRRGRPAGRLAVAGTGSARPPGTW